MTTPHSAMSAPGLAPADRRRIALAAATVMTFFVFSRATGLLREIIIGTQFGTSAELDAYLAAFRIPDLIFQLVAGGALGSAFIPIFAGYWVRGDRPGAWQLFSRTLNLMTLILVGLAALAAIFALPLVQWVIAPGFAPEQQVLTANLMRWMLAGTVVFGAGGLVMGALNALQHFSLPAAAPVAYNLAIILGALLLAPRWGIYGLAIGAVAGSVAHLLVQLPGLWRQGAVYTPLLDLRDAGVREVMRLMGPRMLGLLFVQLHFLVNTILASGLDAGRLSALNYAWLLMLLPLGIFAQAIGTAVFPTFAAQVAAGEREAMRATFGLILRTVFFLTLPAAVGLWVLRVPLVRVLLERGEFGAESTALVAMALQAYAVGLTAHAAVEIGVRAFYALHDTWTPVRIGVGAMLLNIALSLVWVGVWGHVGLALANSVATSVEMALLLWLLHRRMGGFQVGRLAGTLARCAPAAAAGGVAVWLWLAWVEARLWSPAALGPWVAALGGMLLAVVVYLAVAFALRSEEVRPLWDAARRRFAGQGAQIQR
ncbi:MAG: murein biosynthesis integral membrane protein MurJ [Caldilineaceae bacterium]|nr:murein biosynthesis integral membrane protein MurJ [Caldilineaceae bacterium]